MKGEYRAHCANCDTWRTHKITRRHMGIKMLECVECRTLQAISRTLRPRKTATRVNPSALSSLYERFAGTPAKVIARIPQPKTPTTALAIGQVCAIEYVAQRGGETARYRHDFKQHARPMLAVANEGKTIMLLGDNFRFTHRGIEDAKLPNARNSRKTRNH